ncbi:MAG: AAA domain-containing protein [Alteromonadaceae bacterium]|nr:AAA domain-containing protein [Alteromonadaceae bacterium]
MILRDTQIRLVSFADEYVSYSIAELLGSGQIKIRPHDTIDHEPVESHYPIIWLVVVPTVERISSLEIRRYHATNEQILYLVTDERPSILPPHLSDCTLFWQLGATQLLQNIHFAEQRILQRQHFYPAELDDAFLQLNFYGRSPSFLKAVRLIKKVSAADTNVFIKGNTGTGKELTARSIHYMSDRKNEPFIPINCGAFTDELILSELFGHEKGAFTGANKAKVGLLQLANNGTVFLDEVDSLSPKAQVALLRYLQDNEVRPVGGHEFSKVDVRIIAASNTDMKQLIKSKDFREDLMYRLDVLQIALPPLNKRGEDIQLLAQHFLSTLTLEHGGKIKVFSQDMISAMQAYEWEGNVRELDNFVKRAFFLSDGYVIEDTSLLTGTPNNDSDIIGRVSDEIDMFDGFQAAKDELICQFERDYLTRILVKTRGNISKAARIAKKERRSFCRLMEKHGLERRQFAQ